MKKVLCAVMALLLCAGMCACGNKNSGGENTLRVTIRANDTSEALLNRRLQKAFADKKAKDGVTVKFDTPTMFNPGTYMQSIDTLAGANQLGDVVYTYDTDSGLEIKNKMFDPLDGYIEKNKDFKLSDYDEAIMESARTYGNKIAFMPRSSDQMTIMINKKIFKDYKMEEDIPTTAKYGADWKNWTWDEMIALCRKLRQKMNEDGKTADQNYYPLVTKFFYNAVYGPVVESFGGNCVDVT